jgi:hypothetical protein
MSPFSYLELKTPDGYVCDDCDKSGVRLYREYQTFLEYQYLRCRCCALKDQSRTAEEEFESGDSEHSIGWLVAAVPTEDGKTYWGYTSVPEDGVRWWNSLPKQ